MAAVPLFQKPRQLYPRIRVRGDFAQGLACVFWMNEPGGDVVEALSGVRLTRSAGTRVSGRLGLGAHLAGNATTSWTGPAGFTPIKTSNGIGTGDFTLLMVEDPPNIATASFHGLSQGDVTFGFQSNQNSTNAGAASAGRVGFEVYGPTLSFCVTGTTTNTDGTPHVKVCRQTVSGSTATLTVFVDGVKPAQSTAGTVVNDIRGGTPANGHISINDDGEGTTTAMTSWFNCAWNRGLSDAECLLISKMAWRELIDYDHIWNQPNEYRMPRVGGGAPATKAEWLTRARRRAHR